MQYDPSKQGFNNNGNQHVPMNQLPQYETGNAYPPNNVPPPSAQYPQQPPPSAQYSQQPPPGTAYYGQTSAYNPQCVVVTPGYQPGNLLFTPITSSLKVFLLISGSLYLIWGIVDIALDIGIVNNSRTFLYFCGFWTSGFLIAGGISMLVAASKISYVILYLLQMFIVTLVASVLGLILSTVTVISSVRCTFICDSSFATNLKIALLLIFVISTIHTIVNIVMIINSRRKTMLQSTSNVPGNA